MAGNPCPSTFGHGGRGRPSRPIHPKTAVSEKQNCWGMCSACGVKYTMGRGRIKKCEFCGGELVSPTGRKFRSYKAEKARREVERALNR